MIAAQWVWENCKGVKTAAYLGNLRLRERDWGTQRFHKGTKALLMIKYIDFGDKRQEGCAFLAAQHRGGSAEAASGGA